VAWWCFVVAGDRLTAAAAVICLGAAQVISYIKARAEATGLDAGGGLVERADRFVIVLMGTFLQGLGVPHAVAVALWLLAALALITVGQRLVAVWRSAQVEVQAGAGAGAGAEVEAGAEARESSVSESTRKST
jgi:CDP-diacylglycerol--glycerol-3-phosphate 3-phosphatidyltransferase